MRVLTWKCVSRYNGLRFFISHLAICLRTRPFSKSTFPPLRALERHSETRLSYLFAYLHLLSSNSFSSLIFPLLLLSSLTLPTSAFPFAHIVSSLTSKLPSMILWFVSVSFSGCHFWDFWAISSPQVTVASQQTSGCGKLCVHQGRQVVNSRECLALSIFSGGPSCA